ncbi:hypothetical protein GH714_002101 [Hevea brasiliensis]|uniref:Protein FAM33A n=1 Tax=Hevea brasiliensis TaxID=3981 RepID=A0A6A6KWV1_HEVBR|nr:hypothetical protein GH714_002101 [Hevea brasiliensis]
MLLEVVLAGEVTEDGGFVTDSFRLSRVSLRVITSEFWGCYELNQAWDGEEANPIKLVNRIKKMQEDLTTLKEQCRKLLSAKEIIDEWTIQVRSRTGNDGQNSESEDINKLLFSAVVQSN